MTLFRHAACAACLALLLAGCARPLPPDKAAYAGQWRDDRQDVDMRLWIAADGHLEYAWSKPGQSRRMQAPIKEFRGNDIVAGFGPLETTFAVSEPPHKVGNHWAMVVDGVRLQRPDGP